MLLKKYHNWINMANLLLASLVFGLVTAIACEETPGQISISVSGAQESSIQNYYVVEIPEQSPITVTINATGQTPCPTDAEKCTCQHNSDKLTPEKDGGAKYTFNPRDAGNQDANNGSKITWSINSTTTPGEYKFKVTEIEQKYKDCPQGWTGGALSKKNMQASDEVTIVAVKLRFIQVRGALPFFGWGPWGQPPDIGKTWGSGSFTKSAHSATSQIKRINYAPSSGGSCNSVGTSSPINYSTAGLLILEITVPSPYKLDISGGVSLNATKSCSGPGGSAQAIDPQGNVIAAISGASSATKSFNFETGSGNMFVNPNIAIVSSDDGYYDFSGSISIDSINLRK